MFWASLKKSEIPKPKKTKQKPRSTPYWSTLRKTTNEKKSKTKSKASKSKASKSKAKSKASKSKASKPKASKPKASKSKVSKSKTSKSKNKKSNKSIPYWSTLKKPTQHKKSTATTKKRKTKTKAEKTTETKVETKVERKAPVPVSCEDVIQSVISKLSTKSKPATRFAILKATQKQLHESEKEVAAYLAKEVHKRSSKLHPPRRIKPTHPTDIEPSPIKISKPHSTKKTSKKKEKEIELEIAGDETFYLAQQTIQNLLNDVYESHLAEYNREHDPEETESDEDEDEAKKEAAIHAKDKFIEALIDDIDETLKEHQLHPGKTFLTDLANDIFSPREEYDERLIKKTISRWLKTVRRVAHNQRKEKFKNADLSMEEDQFYNDLLVIFRKHTSIKTIAKEIHHLQTFYPDVTIDLGIFRHMAGRFKINDKQLLEELRSS